MPCEPIMRSSAVPHSSGIETMDSAKQRGKCPASTKTTSFKTRILHQRTTQPLGKLSRSLLTHSSNGSTSSRLLRCGSFRFATQYEQGVSGGARVDQCVRPDYRINYMRVSDLSRKRRFIRVGEGIFGVHHSTGQSLIAIHSFVHPFAISIHSI